MPWGISLMADPSKSPSRTLIAESQPPKHPHTRPMTPAPLWCPTPTQSRSSKGGADPHVRAPWGHVPGVWTGLVDPQAGLGQVRDDLFEGWALFRAKSCDLSKTGLKP